MSGKKEKNEEIVKIYVIYNAAKIYLTVMEFLTRFPPFSYFFLTQKFHHRHEPVKRITRPILDEYRKLGYEIYMDDYNVDQYFYTCYCTVERKKKDISDKDFKEIIKKKLNFVNEDIYIKTEETNKIRISISKDLKF